MVNKGEVVVSEFRKITSDTSADSLRITIILEIFVIGKDGNRVSRAGKEMAPIVEATYDSKEFAVVDVVVAFCVIECL